VRNRAAWIAGALGAAGVAFRARRRRPAPASDPRADELRRKLDESKPLVEDREEIEAGETTVDQAEPAPRVRESEAGEAARREREPRPADTVAEKRAAVHDRARAAARDMRGSSEEV
jgi:hypothetical protein